jgi:hypothetical protein
MPGTVSSGRRGDNFGFRCTRFPCCSFAQYPRGGTGMLCLLHAFASPTSEIPSRGAILLKGSRHTISNSSVRWSVTRPVLSFATTQASSSVLRISMKALSIRAPWAWAILYAGKDIENRSRRTKHRGLLLVHSSLRKDKAAIAWLRRRGFEFPTNFPTGALVGVVDVVECFDKVPRNRWAVGPHCYLLKNPRIFRKPIPWRGQLGMFEVPDPKITMAIRNARKIRVVRSRATGNSRTRRRAREL